MTILFYSIIEIFSLVIIYQASKKYKNKGYNSFFILVGGVLFFVIAFRALDVGTDYRTYHDAMIRVAENKELDYDYSWLSYGFRMLIKMVALLGFPSEIVAYLVSALMAGGTIYFFLRAIKELSVNPTMSLFIFFCFCYFFQAMNQFRQMFAIAVVFYAYKYINVSFQKYVVLILVAGCIHSSALIMIPVYFVVKIKLTKKVVGIYFISMLLIGGLWEFIKKLIEFTPYYYYLGWEEYDTSLKNSTLMNLFVRIILVCFCLLLKKRVTKCSEKNEVLYHLVLICTMLQVVSVYISMFSRITTYFYCFYILLLPEVFSAIKNRFVVSNRQYISIGICFVLLLYQLVYFNAQSVESGYSIYKFLFFI